MSQALAREREAFPPEFTGYPQGNRGAPVDGPIWPKEFLDKERPSFVAPEISEFPRPTYSDVKSRPVTSTQVVAEWEGVVASIHDDFFVAEMYGKIGQGVAGSYEEAEIPLTEVNSDDKELVRPGAFFRLCVTREMSSAGTVQKYTQVIFRRLPAYRREELEKAREEALDLARDIRVE